MSARTTTKSNGESLGRHQQRVTQLAQTLKSRIEQIDTNGQSELENFRQYELGSVQFMIELLGNPSLTASGLRFLSKRIRLTDEWIDDIDSAEAE